MAQTSKPVSILIPDGESFHLIAVLQCLSLEKGFRVVMFSNKRFPSMRFSRHVSKFIYCPAEKSSEEWVRQLKSCIKDQEIEVVMPMSEPAAEALLMHRENFDFGSKLLLPESLEEFMTASDKRKLACHLEQHDLPSPNFWLIQDWDAPELDKIRFPALLKPAVLSGGGVGISMLRCREDLDVFLAKKESGEELLVQEYIEGYDLGCNVLCKDGVILAYTVQVGNQFDDQSFTPQIGLEIKHEEEVMEIAARLMKSLRWSGVANIDLRYDQVNSRYLILEVNPRYWLTLLASALAGVNFPWLYCLALKGLPFETPVYNEISFTNLKGLQQWARKNPGKLLKWKYLWQSTPVRFLAKDPAMTISHYGWVLKRAIAKLLKVGQAPPKI